MSQVTLGAPAPARAPALELPAPFVLLTGGKGGVGKTTLAANLAVELSRAGHRVLLVDLDLGLGNVHLSLALDPARTIEDCLLGGMPLAEVVTTGPAGVDLLAASSGAGALAAQDAGLRARLVDGLCELAPRYDFVIGDSAAGIGPDVLSYAAGADHVLAVTTPDPAALTDAYGVIKALDAHARERGVEVPTPELFLNLVAGVDEARQVASKLRGVCERFLSRSPQLAGWLPRASAVLAAGARQVPFVLERRTSLETGGVRRLAQRLERRFSRRG